MRYSLFGVILLAMGCTLQAPPQSGQSTSPTQTSSSSATETLNLDAKQRNFVDAVRRMEPLVERSCRQRAPDLNCDFHIVVDDRPNQDRPNAFQTLDKNGRPVLGFNLALIYDVRNQDEIAFVIGHEASHHILRHLARQQQNAAAGAVVFGTLAAIIGGNASAVNQATQIGASVGARTYSKDMELEADFLGAKLTIAGGYDAVRGAAYFTRVPDPGDEFLGTHPPNAERVATVRRAAGL